MVSWLLLAGAAGAAAPVLDAGGAPDQAMARVVLATKRPVGDFAPARIETLLLGKGTSLVGVGELGRCTSAESSVYDVSNAVRAAEEAVSYSDFAAVGKAVSEGEVALGCLTGPADPAYAARLWYLAGVARTAAGDGSGAWAAYRRARLFKPDMTWDEDFPPDGRAAFEAVGAEIAAAAPSDLRVVPQPDVLRIDGHIVAGVARVVDGDHLVQLGEKRVETWQVKTQAGAPVALVVPLWVTSGAVAWVEDPELRPSLGAVLSLAGDETWIATETRLVRYSNGKWDVVQGDPLPEAAVAVALPPAPVRPGWGRWMATGGGAVFATGAGLAVLAKLAGEQAVVDGDLALASLERDAYAEAQERYAGAEGRLATGYWIAGAGAALAGAGLVVRW